MQLLNHLKKRRANGRGWDERCGWKESMRTGITLLALSVVFSLSGCGGGGSGNNGGSSSNVVSGIVADGYINGATVCLDMNKNSVCDPTEPSTQTVAGGAFSLPLANPNDINLYPLVAEVPPTAIDEDTGKPVGKGYVLSSPAATKAPFISPISTLVQAKIAQGVTPAQAVIDVKTGLDFPANSTVDITSNFINSTVLSTVNKQKLRISAQVIARVFAANNDVVKATLKKAGIKNKASQVNALVYKKASSQLGSIQQYASSIPKQVGPVQTVNIPSTISLSLNSSTFATDIALTPVQKNQLNTTLTGQGATIPTTTPQLAVNPDGSCVVGAIIPNALGGLFYSVDIPANKSVVFCFEVTESTLDSIVKIQNTIDSVKFELKKKLTARKFSKPMKSFSMLGGYERFYKPGLVDRSLTKGIYKITFSGDQWYFKKHSAAKVNIYSNSNSRVVQNIKWVGKNNITIQSNPLPKGTTIIKGSLNRGQDAVFKNVGGKSIIIGVRDVIPLNLSTQVNNPMTLANVIFNVVSKGGAIFDVSLMNAAYGNIILTSSLTTAKDWEVWRGTSVSLANQTFNFSTHKNTDNAYYLVLTRLPKLSTLVAVDDDIPYTVTVTTSTVPAVTFTTGATPKNYQVGSYDKPVTAAKGMFGAATITTAAGSLPKASPSEFLTNTQNAKNLTSAMQTFKSVMEFDGGSTMRFYADYVDTINGVNNANAAVSLLDAAAGAAAGFLTGNYLGVADSLAITAAKASVGMSLAQSSKYHGTIFMSYSFNLLRTYEQKKKSFINEVYALNVPISADLIGNSPILQSKLMELFVLQSRATRIMKFAMDLYKLTAQPNSQSYLAFMADRAANFAISFVPNSGVLGVAANTLNSINGDLQLLVTDLLNFANLAKTLSTTWASLLNDSKYFSYYDPLVQANNLKILKNQGYVFDKILPVITLTGAKNIVIAQGATYNDAGATATDTIDGNLTVKIKRVNNVNTFIPSVYQVTYNVNDSAANAAIQVVRSVTVTATPLFTPPKNITVTAAQGATSVAATNAKIAAFLKGATPSNRVVGLITNNAPVSFPVAKPTTVTFMAKDTAGIIATATATVTVKAASPVTVTAPASITVIAAKGATSVLATNSKIVAFLKAASAANNVSSLTVTNNAPTSFPTGITTTVIFTAKDAAGNTGTATATVTVKKAIAIKDTIPPAVTPPNPLLMTFSFAVTSIPKANSKITAFLAAATATDKVGVVGGVTNNAPANFPVGTTTVTFTAKDAAGNIGTATATVTIKAIAPTAALVDGFDYPLGNRGVNANGLPLPFLEQITPEINSNYTNKTVTVNDYGRFAVNANAAKWRNAQDVGSFNSAQGGVHPGEDWNLGAGDSDKGQPVYAVANGTVIAVRSTYRSGYLLGGWTMVLEHTLSNGSKLYSFYAHVTDSKETLGVLTTSAAKFSLKVGDVVTRGQMIARLAAGSKTVGGMTNFTSHLHLEMRTIKPMLTVGGGLWEGDNGLGYYTHLTPIVPRRANAIRRPVTMTATQINTAYARMQTSLGIIDPSDYIDAHRAGLVGKVTSISPQTVVSGTPTLFTITGTSLPSTLAASLQGSLKGSCSAVMVNTAGTSATITCTPGALNTGASFYIKNVSGGLILPSSVAFTVTVNATAPVKDTTPPVITLTGAATVRVSQGQNYVDAGATALDLVDGNLTTSIIANSTVNTSTLGTYQVTYDVSDAAANAATQVVRTVNVVAATNPVVTTLNNGLVAYYPFDGYATDASGNGNNGTPMATVSFGAGHSGQAAVFGGVDNPGHIHIPNSPSLTFVNGATYSLWVRVDALRAMDGWGSVTTAYGGGSILAKSHDRTGGAIMFNVDALNQASLGFATFETWPTVGAEPVARWTPTKTIGQWSHVVMTLSATTGKKLYIDGKLYHVSTGPVSFTSMNTQDIFIGKFSDSWYPFYGAIDDVRIYNRALTATEVLALAGGNLTNQAPAPTAPRVITTVGVAGTSQIAANDPNFLDTHTYAVSTMPTNGTASVDRYGLATYTPNATYVGADSFVVTVTDNTGLSSAVTVNVTVKNTAGTLVFRDDFINANALQTNWAVVASSVPCCGAGNPTVNSVSAGKLTVTTNGGSDGFMGIPDGSTFTPSNVQITGDFVVEMSFQELWRKQTLNFKDNSGISLAIAPANATNTGLVSMQFVGNFVGYFPGYAYNQYQAHRITGWSPAGMLFNDEFGLNSLYSAKFRIRRIGNIFTLGYQMQGSTSWIERSATVNGIAGVIPSFSIGSGDGGGTRQNGSFSASIDYFAANQLPVGVAANLPPAPTAPAINTVVGVTATSQIAANDPNVADTHTYAVSTAAINGTASVDAVGLVTYTPNAGYVGADSFVVTVTDGRGLAGLLTINVTVN